MEAGVVSNLENIGIFVGIILATIILAFLVNRFFKRLIDHSTKHLNNDPTNYLFLRHAVIFLIYIVGFSIAIFMMPNLRALASSLLAGAGIIAVGISFASQHALSNIISGIFIIIFKPFRVNDRIKVRELSGFIEDITLRHTVIRDFENKRIIIPNALISDEIIVNSDFTDTGICKWIDIGISYDSDLLKAKQIIKDEIKKHALHYDNRTKEMIAEGIELAPVKVIALGDSSVNLRGWAWARNAADAFSMSCDLLESIKLRFDKEDIEIPFPHRTLVYKKMDSDHTITPIS